MNIRQVSPPAFVGNMDLMSQCVDYFMGANKAFECHRFSEAANLYRNAISLFGCTSPRFQDCVLLNFATALYKAGNYDESKATLLNNSFSTADINRTLGYLYMLDGDYAAGFKYMNITRNAECRDGRSFLGCSKFWNGKDDLSGKRIFLIADGSYGIGDYIALIRFLKPLSNMGAKITMEVSKSFNGLDFDDVKTVLYPTQPYWVKNNFDYVAFQLSLPYLLKTELNTLPTDSYIRPINQRPSFMPTNESGERRMRVGICWSGSKVGIDEERFFSFDKLSPLLALDIEFHSLQIEYREDDLAGLNQSRLINHASSLKNLSDTAHLICEMDLVISVDTAVAHLTGAMGHPLWVMRPSYKNFYWDGDQPHWYPHARCYRQPSEGDWEGVIERVKFELATLAQAKLGGLQS